MREWLVWLGQTGGTVLGFAVLFTVAAWAVETTCPTCPWEARAAMVGLLLFGLPVLLIVPLVLIVGWPQWRARMHRGKLKRQEFED